MLDVGAGKMYWTYWPDWTPERGWGEQGTGKIQRANLDGTGVQDVVTGLGWPEGLALDTSGRDG